MSSISSGTATVGKTWKPFWLFFQKEVSSTKLSGMQRVGKGGKKAQPNEVWMKSTPVAFANLCRDGGCEKPCAIPLKCSHGHNVVRICSRTDPEPAMVRDDCP